MKEITILMQGARNCCLRFLTEDRAGEVVGELEKAITDPSYAPTIHTYAGYARYRAGEVVGYDIGDPELGVQEAIQMNRIAARITRWVQEASEEDERAARPGAGFLPAKPAN